MKDFYFTFGSYEGFPFHNGYINVKADDINQAARIFKALYPNPADDEVLNCSDYYTKEQFFNSENQYMDYLGSIGIIRTFV